MMTRHLYGLMDGGCAVSHMEKLGRHGHAFVRGICSRSGTRVGYGAVPSYAIGLHFNTPGSIRGAEMNVFRPVYGDSAAH